MISTKLAFLDIETSGGRCASDRIIEIGILRIEDNQVVKTYNTLVNPDCYVSPFIENYTGINKTELEQAPRFSQVKDVILELLDDCVLVAHNVRFDYGFLKNEFNRLGITFSIPHFCTVKLSRQLYPHYPKHNLDALIERFSLPCPQRHRALDDARAIWHFYQIIQQEFDQDRIEKSLKLCLKRPSLPAALSRDLIDNLPTTPGVYIFYGAEGYPLYVGKSINIKERVLSHFSSDYTSSREMNICQQVEQVEALPTCGELGALLQESKLVKTLQPLYNRKLRQSRRLVVVKKGLNSFGYQTAEIETIDSINPDQTEAILGVFRSVKQAKDFLLAAAKAHCLCHKLLNLEKSNSTCFGYQLNVCHGACFQKEEMIRYNLRFLTAFGARYIKSWPFNSPIIIEEKSGSGDKSEAFVVGKWCLLGVYNMALGSEEMPSQEVPAQFDLDAYKILVRYVSSPKNATSIKRFSPAAYADSAQ